MGPIVTLTLNPSVDVQWSVDKMVPEHKIRSSRPLNFPGGGGINVSRVIRALGGTTIAIHTAGWSSGQFLRELVEQHGLLTRTIPITDRTRVSATAFDESTGYEYRITPPGPILSESEWQACLDAVFEFDSGYIVATGSLPEGVPVDYYGQIAAGALRHETRVVLDTSGDALTAGLAAGVYLLKPSLRELETLCDRKATSTADQASMARDIVDKGQAEIVAVTLGGDGALLVWSGGTLRLRTPKVDVKSTVGAGDSFVGGMTYGLYRRMSVEDAFALGVACGTASVLTAGTELCRRDDVERIYRDLTDRNLTLPRAAE